METISLEEGQKWASEGLEDGPVLRRAEMGLTCWLLFKCHIVSFRVLIFLTHWSSFQTQPLVLDFSTEMVDSFISWSPGS